MALPTNVMTTVSIVSTSVSAISPMVMIAAFVSAAFGKDAILSIAPRSMYFAAIDSARGQCCAIDHAGRHPLHLLAGRFARHPQNPQLRTSGGFCG